jgi:hypothetical protein
MKTNYIHINEMDEIGNYINFITYESNAGRNPLVFLLKNAKINENEEYTPGGRIYIKLETLKKQEGYIDFLDHYCVKESLNLTEVEYEIITPKELGERKWTPKRFSDEANKLFMERIK